MLRVGVLASGGGTDFQSIIDAVEGGKVDCEIAVLVTNKTDAYALKRAEGHGIPAVCIPHKGKSREEHEHELARAMDEHGVELVVLAGYIRMLTPWFVDRYMWKMINIHPALLPLFGGSGMHGLNVHRAVLDAGCKVSGCSVHFVTADVDGGPIIAQRCVPVLEGDSPESLAGRVLVEEHRLLPAVIQLFADGRIVVVDDKRVRVLPGVERTD